MPTTVSLIYAYWPQEPFGVSWCHLPWKLRDAGIAKRLQTAGHDIVESILMSEDEHPEDLRSAFRVAGEVTEVVRASRAKGELPIVLCGSCSIAALGSVAGLGTGADTGIAWLDAHPDLNTPETTSSGLFEGMALAIATGHAWRNMGREIAELETPASLAKTALVGARDIDPGERELITAHNVPNIDPTSISANEAAAQINARLADTKTTYLHLDMDVHDRQTLNANAFAVSGGPNTQDIANLLPLIDRVGAIAITGLDPVSEDASAAAKTAIDYVAAVAKDWIPA